MNKSPEGSSSKKPFQKKTYKKPSSPKVQKISPNRVRRPKEEEPTFLRLNKFLAHAGVASRREADTIIEQNRVTVNGKPISEMGYQVKTTDAVKVDGAEIRLEPFTYVLMNKPSNTITTTSDEKGRKTVMDVVHKELGLRLYPVGRLDRNTTGALLLTNDGDLANRLMHPKYSTGKTYEVHCNRSLSTSDLEQLLTGVELEDGAARAIEILKSPNSDKIIYMAVEEGRNHLVKRMIAATGAEVTKLKRTHFAGLDLKGLRVGRWRYLKPEEVNKLRKMVKLPELTLTKK